MAHHGTSRSPAKYPAAPFFDERRANNSPTVKTSPHDAATTSQSIKFMNCGAANARVQGFTLIKSECVWPPSVMRARKYAVPSSPMQREFT